MGRFAFLVATLALGCGGERAAETTATPAPTVAPGTVQIVADGVFTLDVPGPVVKKEGSDAEGGTYELRGCFLGYSTGQFQTALEPGALGFPDEYLHRVSPLDGLPVRWATFRQSEDPRGMEGRYRVAIYRPGIGVEAACWTPEARDQASAWLATVKFKRRDGSDRTGIKELVGPATFSPAPDLCTLSAEPPIGATSVATVRVELPEEASINQFELRSPSTPKPLLWERYDSPIGEPPELFVPAGTYTIDIDVSAQPTVRCAPVELKPGQRTTVRVQRFRI